jgi:hypothetical protein
MRRFIKYAALITMVLMLGSTVWANSYTDHVTVAPNNKGDVLIFPWFLALDGGWQTKLTVINTDKVNSVVAKLIIRSYHNSEELLDFFLYLSPADVWNGVIKYSAAKRAVVMFSSDDSALSAIAPSLVWANVTPIDQIMFPLQTCTVTGSTGDGDWLGYVEVVSIAAGPVAPAAPGVKKLDIYNAYVALLAGGTTLLDYAGDLAQGSRINSLAGFMQFQNPLSGFDSAMSATTLKDYGNLEAATTGSETRLGTTAMNTLGEIEAALSKDDIALPYVNNDDLALYFFTFPTKLTEDCGPKARGPYFDDSDRCVPYTVTTYDLTEKSPSTGSPFSGGGSTTNKFCSEVNFLASVPFEYAEGWANYLFNNKTDNVAAKDKSLLDYDGTPVIATYLYLGATGMSANYGAWTDELVFCDRLVPSTLFDYQYTDSAEGLCIIPK